MPVTVRGTDILFNDGSTQNTAAGSVTTTAVLNATAGASVGAVGTYACLRIVASVQVSPGGTVAGSSLRYSGVAVNDAGNFLPASTQGGTPSGTWRIMGFAQNLSTDWSNVTTWLRIS